MSEPLVLELNGQRRELAPSGEQPALTDVLTALGFKLDRIAVEQNGAIVRRADWPTAVIRSGDKLEVVHFVGGGCQDVLPETHQGLHALGSAARFPLSSTRSSSQRCP